VASLGHEARQRRQPLYPKEQANVVKPCGPVSTDNVLRLLERQQFCCALTGRELMPQTAALDHIIPIRCDGEHVIENTQVLHKEVNRAKGSLTNDQFSRLCREVVEHTAITNTEGASHED
jgi:5-methylcytosine-specific restriction endonuclease McrA